MNSKTMSKAALTLVKALPDCFSKKAVKDLTTDPKKAVFGFEDADTAFSYVELDNERVEKNGKDALLEDLFNAKLRTQLEILKTEDTALYQDFTDKMLEIKDIIGQIDVKVGDDFNALINQVSQVLPEDEQKKLETMIDTKYDVLDVEKKLGL